MAPSKGTPRVPKGTPKHPSNQLQVTTPKVIPSTPRRKPKPAAENESPDHLSSPFTPSIYTAPTPLKNAKVSPIPKTPVYKETATQTTTPRYSPGTINNPIVLSSPKTPKTPDTPSEWHFDSNSIEGEAPSELSDDYESDFYLRSTPCPGGDDKDDEEDGDGIPGKLARDILCTS
ncbi:Protein of unknown function [Pyronema omphalodes CBS 100304]|uniref:Uncharacterized protein n=1 Tax=Pyronema omphalodes (strain CBS 100304) TaxID=1076935 RepID=U4LEL6_PYROM|nr:Protein of unknown function [Pyronema omphalodes CBS 100304]